ncbi:Rubredoxin [Filimonas lacunae]|uniref:Rubredoxin n=1 Tax=Filimonas lacunae TaxID=477680 RepID=A0A1N7QWW6_9BACT|nr:rubredoxin [Filimonas lacunae]SIT27336.1 Rubredoxin [Filimonas lacunae]
MKRYQTIAVNFTGGIISPGNLLNILEAATQFAITHISFSLRQQLLMEVPVTAAKGFLQALTALKTEAAPLKSQPPNVFSSYVCTDIFAESSWMTEGAYKDVFALLQTSVRKLKVNICSAQQTFVPLFTGHINWIAGLQKHYWYLYVRFPGTNTLYCWPEMIYTNDIETVTSAVEQWITTQKNTPPARQEDGVALYTAVKGMVAYISRPIDQDLTPPVFHLPYYEGFNKYGAGYWLGIYRRDEWFPIPFLQNIARLCLESKIGELHATPWKSIIIKNISPTQRRLWDSILGHYRINVRHAANELNWWVEDGNEDALVVKRHVIRYFDKEDVRTYGLCFGVLLKHTAPSFGSVLIQQKEGQTRISLKSQVRYDIYYSEDFNPNAGHYLLYREGVEKDHLGPYLVSLSKLFYEKAAVLPERTAIAHLQEEPATQRVVYQCTTCTTIYDPEQGDIRQGVQPGTPYEQLPEDYTCSVCMAPVQELSSIHYKK